MTAAMIQYAAICTEDDPLSAARGMLFGSMISIVLWAMILTATRHLF